MQLNRKTTLQAALWSAVVLFGAGCSGINTSQGVSPATFLLPGFFGQAQPQAAPGAEQALEPPVDGTQALAPAN